MRHDPGTVRRLSHTGRLLWPSRMCAALCVVAITGIDASAVASARPSERGFDHSSIVFGRSIGDVRLGQSQDQVEYLYGDTNKGKLETLDNYFPRGTKYAGKPLVQMTYRLHCGTLRVSYVD